MSSTGIILFGVSFIVVIIRMMLEYQKDVDKYEGHEQGPSCYTISGMLRMMREDKKAEKEEKRAARRTRHYEKHAEQKNARHMPEVPVKRFHTNHEDSPTS